MKVVLDTNILVSALITPSGISGKIHELWKDGSFHLTVSEEQIRELQSTFSKPHIRKLVAPYAVGKLINDLRSFGIVVDSYPRPSRSIDPNDNYLLGMAEAASAQYLVTGDKGHLLSLVRHKQTRSLSARQFLDRIG